MASSKGECAAERRPSHRASSFPRRFYEAISILPVPDGFALHLDARSARTPGRNPLVLPNRPLAEAVAAEWSSVAETIDPRAMPLTRLANTVIDGVATMQHAVVAEIVRFAGSDLLAYRASEPDDLVQAQRGAWDPVVAWMRETHGAPFLLTEGIVHVAQPSKTLQRVDTVVRDLAGGDAAAPFRIAAIHVITTLTGSALLAMAVASKHMSPAQAWTAAHVDEDYQASKWGDDAEAKSRRALRWIEMNAACTQLDLADRGETTLDTGA